MKKNIYIVQSVKSYCLVLIRRCLVTISQDIDVFVNNMISWEKLCSWPCHDGSGMQTSKRPSQLTETVAVCTRPAPIQTRQGPSTE